MRVNSGDTQPNLTMRNALAVQQKLCFPLLRKGGGPLSPPQHVRVPLEFPLQLFFIGGRALIQGVHHEHHVGPRWDSGMARPHDLKAQEAECLQEWSYQREGDVLPPGIILFTSPLSHEYQSAWDTLCECIQSFLCKAQPSPAGVFVSSCAHCSCS